MKRAKPGTIVGLLCVANFACATPVLDWFKTGIFKGISITGNRILGFHLQSVSGDTQAYNFSNNNGQGLQNFTDTGQMSILGNNVLGVFNFNFQFADNTYQDPTAHQFSIDYNKRGLAFDAGDIQGTVHSTNRFLSFYRQLYGVQAGFTKGRAGFHLLQSRASSSIQTVSFPGNNSQGPYYLQTSQINPNTVRVQVDGQELTYPNDFTVDSVIGSITFTSRSIAPTSTIIVSYETTGVNSGGGEIQGGDFNYDFGVAGALDIGVIRQTDPNGGGLSSTTDLFQGYGDASIPYYLQYQPMAGFPVVIRVDGLLQSQGVDYTFSPTNPTVFYFLRPIPSTSTISVTYTPRPSDNTHGDRQVVGFDYRLPLGLKGRDGSLIYSQAMSHLSNAVQPMSGTARDLAGEFRYKHYRFTADFDDIPNTFVGVDTTSFLRNERATKTSLAYQYKGINWGLDQQNSSIGIRQTDNSGNISFVSSRSTSLVAHLGEVVNSNTSWRLNQSRLAGSSPSGDTRADLTTLTLTHSMGALESNIDIERTQGFGPITNGLTTAPGSVNLQTFGLTNSYAFKNGLTFGSTTSISAVDSAGQKQTGKDISFRGNYYSPNGSFSGGIGYSYSNSGQLATLGSFQSGIGFGYGANGFSGGYVDPTNSTGAFNAGGTDVRMWRANGSWALHHGVTLSSNFVTYTQAGSSSTNSDSTSYGITADFQAHHWQHIGVNLNQTFTSFIGSNANSNSTTLNLGWAGNPKGPWSFNLQLNALLSSGGSFAQNSLGYSANLRRRLNKDQAISFDAEYQSISSYQPYVDSSVGLAYEYRLFANVGLIGRYRIHSVTTLDSNAVSGAYNSRGFDLELSLNFAP